MIDVKRGRVDHDLPEQEFMAESPRGLCGWLGARSPTVHDGDLFRRIRHLGN